MNKIIRASAVVAAVTITSPIGLAFAGGGATDSGALWMVHALSRLVETVRNLL